MFNFIDAKTQNVIQKREAQMRQGKSSVFGISCDSKVPTKINTILKSSEYRLKLYNHSFEFSSNVCTIY